MQNVNARCRCILAMHDVGTGADADSMRNVNASCTVHDAWSMQTFDADVDPMHGLSMQTTYDARRLTMHDVYHGQRTTSSMLVVDADPRRTTSMQNVNASCTMHHRCITTTRRCRVRARGRLVTCYLLLVDDGLEKQSFIGVHF